MRRWTTAALVIGLLATTALGAPADARDERSRAAPPAAEQRAGIVKFVGQVWDSEPGPNGTVIQTDGIVYVPVKHARGVKCTAFSVQRTATHATVSANCTAPNGRGKRIATLEVSTAAYAEFLGHDPDLCRDRHDIRKNPVFECTVELPDEVP